MKPVFDNLKMDILEATLKNSDEYVKDMLQFYEEGHSNGWEARGTNDRNLFEARLKANVISTLTYVNEVIKVCDKVGIQILSAYIKLENPKSMQVLLSVPLADYLKKELRDVYKHIHLIEKSSRSDDYRVGLSITYDDGSLDADTLTAEGFIQTHSTENLEEAAR